MSKNNSSAPSLAALKMVGRKPVSGVKRGKSSSETALVSRQIVSRRSSGVKSTGRNTARKTTTQTETLAAFKAIRPKTKIAKEDCDCIMVAIAIFCSSLVALDFFEDRAANTAGSVDIAEDIIYGRYGDSGVDTDDLHQGHENTHQGVGKAKAFQQAPYGNADDDRDTDGTCDIDLDDNRGGMVEHIVEQVPDTAGVNYQHQKGKGD